MPAEGSENVDFEIAFASLLTTSSVYLTIEAFAYEWVVEAIAIGLLMLTLIRRVGLMNGLENTHPIFPVTTYVMSGISYVVTFYLVFWIAEQVANLVPFEVLPVFIVLTPPIVLGLLIVHEIAMGGGFMREAENAFTSAAIDHNGSLPGAVFEHIADTARQSRTDMSSSYKQTRLSDYRDSQSFDEATPKEQKAVLVHVIGGAVGLLSPILVYGALGVVLAFWTDLSIWLSIFLIVCYLMITGLIDGWFSGYGLIRLGETNGKYKGVMIIVGIIFCFHTLPP